jgi:hypothetical protein
VPRKGNGLDAGVDAERPEQVADVVSNRLGAQVQRAGDLVGRVAPLQQAKDLRLPRREMGMERLSGSAWTWTTCPNTPMM